MRNLKASSRIESLESRIAPATITVSFLKGALVLDHGSDPHTFSIVALDDVTTMLVGTNATEFSLDGGPASTSLLLTGALKSLSVNLGAFDDEVNLMGLNLGGDVTITGGGGEDTIKAESLTVKGRFKYTGGAEADSMTLGAGSVFVKKDFILDMGEGDNLLASSAALQIGGKLSYTGGSGDDEFKTSDGSVRIGGDLSFKPGAGDGAIGTDSGHPLGSFTVGKKLIFDSSASQIGDTGGFAVSAAAVKIGGDFQITDGAGDLGVGTQALSLTIGGRFLVTAGAGTFTAFSSSGLIAKSVSFDASASTASNVFLTGFGKIPGGFTYTGGSGADLAQIAFLSSSGALGPIVVNLGAGNNTALVGGFFSPLKTVKLIGGSGDDNFTFLSGFANASSVEMQLGGGTNVASMSLSSATVAGKVSVTSAADATSGNVTINAVDAVIGSLELFLPGGNNQVNLGSTPPPPDPGGPGGFNPFTIAQGPINGLTIKKAFKVTTGDGLDKVEFRDAVDLTVAGGINLQLGNGINGVGGTPSNFVTKNLTVVGGFGIDIVSFTATGRLGAVSLTLGAGQNVGTLSGGVTQLALASLLYSSTTETGVSDALTLARLVVAGKTDTKFGAGETELKVDDSIFNGVFLADTGAGEDTVSIDTTFTLYYATIFAKPVTILLGADDDTLELGNDGSIITKATFTADGGTGTNEASNAPDNIFAKPPGFINFATVN